MTSFPYLRALLSLLLTLSAGAGCVEHGHYAILAHTGTLRGTPWPYSEDLASRQDQLPIGDGVIIGWNPERPWTKIQTGCSAYSERNVFASEEVNLILRASFTFSDSTKKAAITGTRYQVQLRLGDEVILDEIRRLDGRYPHSQRFGAVARNVPKGSYVYSMWCRLLDGPRSNQVILGLQWITAQGMPARYPAATAETAGPQTVSEKWGPVGPQVRVETAETSDLILLSSLSSDARVVAGYTVDTADGKRSTREPQIIRSSMFDQRLQLPASEYVVRLWARSIEGEAVVEHVRTDVAVLPLGKFPMYEASADDPVVVTSLGDANVPLTLSPVCGLWTRLLEFDTPSVSGDFSWFLHAYVELERVVGHGYAEIAIQTVRSDATPRPGMMHATDMGIVIAQLSPGGDGVSFFGDASSWGNAGGNRMSLWIRIIEGCNGAGFGNELTVGKRSLAVKLLPTTSILLP
jgi:hypothetical protein